MDIFGQWAEIKKEEGIEEGLEKGIEKGIEKTTRQFVENLLKDSTFPVEKIASLANTTAKFVRKVKKELR